MRTAFAVSQNILWSSQAAAKAASKDTELTQGGAAEELRHDSALSFPLDFHGRLSLKPESQRQLDMTLTMSRPYVGLVTDYFITLSITLPGPIGQL